MNPPALTGGGPAPRSRPNLYDLLPSLYRRRDAEIYESDLRELVFHNVQNVDEFLEKTRIPPLKALFAILQSQYDELERDIASLYDDWFIETCSPEMIARLAEPLAIRELEALRKGGADIRAIVANIAEYRTRKGTLGALEEYASDATGWSVRASDAVHSLARTMRVDDAAPPLGYLSVRRRFGAADARSADDGKAISVSGHGGGPRSLRVHVWPAKAVKVTAVEPGIADRSKRRRTFSPLGDDKVLLRPPEDDDGRGYAQPLTREHARADLARSGTIYGLDVRETRGDAPAVPPLGVADLSAWAEPRYGTSDPRTVFVDPELGRMLVPAESGVTYSVDYHVAQGDGVGSVPRSAPWPGTFARTLVVGGSQSARGKNQVRLWEAELINSVLAAPSLIGKYHGTLREIDFVYFASEWAYVQDTASHYYAHFASGWEFEAASNGVASMFPDFAKRFSAFRIEHTPAPLDAKAFEAFETLVDQLVAATRKSPDDPTPPFESYSTLADALVAACDGTGSVRIVLGDSQTHSAPHGEWKVAPAGLDVLSIESAPGARPTLEGALFLVPPKKRVMFALRGLNVRGRIVCGMNADVEIDASTLRPGEESGRLRSIEDELQHEAPVGTHAITVRGSFVGGALLTDGTELLVEDSVVTHPVAPRVHDRPGPFLTSNRVTFLDDVEAYELTASDTLFDRKAAVRILQRGYVRYCAYRAGSRLPQGYKSVEAQGQLLASTRFGHAHFARLRRGAPPEIRTGGSDGSEIGAYSAYEEPRRQENLDCALAEFVPEGVAVKTIYHR